MAKVQAPLLSLTAWGTIGNSITFARQGIRTHARAQKTQSAHCTQLQADNRDVFRNATRFYTDNHASQTFEEDWRRTATYYHRRCSWRDAAISRAYRAQQLGLPRILLTSLYSGEPGHLDYLVTFMTDPWDLDTMTDATAFIGRTPTLLSPWAPLQRLDDFLYRIYYCYPFDGPMFSQINRQGVWISPLFKFNIKRSN